ncbi:arabinose transporter [Escherichia coli]
MQVTPTKPVAQAESVEVHLSRPALGVITALFCGYLAVGLPLPVIPLFVHEHLGFSNFIVGLVIGIQFLATVLTRGYAGRVADQQGGKRSAVQGAVVSTIAGLLYLVAAIPSLTPTTSLGLIIIGRVAAGLGESQFVTGCVSWSIASVGPQRAGISMSWTGIAMFGALTVGAPVGMWLYQAYGLSAAMMACVVTPVIAAIIAMNATAYLSPGGPGLPLHKVISRIWREGLGLMLSGAGMSGLATFASLYFAARHWDNAGLVMTSFGIGFIFVRLALGHLPDRMGGYRVALWSLVVEAVGMVMLWGASNEWMAQAGALITGLGCALIYPALGVEVLKRVPPANRGSAMGAFVAFLDIAYGIAGPVAGVVASHYGYPSVYMLGAICALLGAILAATSSQSQS